MPRKLLLGGLAALLLTPALYVGLADGGAPPRSREGGAIERSARLESWTLVSASHAADEGGWACDHQTPCDPARLLDRAARGHHCAWTGTFWMAAGWDHPIVLRGPSLRVFALAEAGDGAPLPDGRRNLTRAMTTFWHGWTDGHWWRAEEERVTVAVPLPCDARRLAVTLNVEGRTPGGGLHQRAQGVEVVLVPT